MESKFTFDTSLPVCSNNIIYCGCDKVHYEVLSINEKGESEFYFMIAEKCEREEKNTIHTFKAVLGEFHWVDSEEDVMDVCIYSGEHRRG